MIYIRIFIGVLLLGLMATIYLKQGKIELLESELKNKNNEIIKEIEVCNNQKELESVKRQMNEYKRIFDDAITSRKIAENLLEVNRKRMESIEKEFNDYKNEDIKCLNETVDKNYLKTIKGAINDKK